MHTRGLTCLWFIYVFWYWNNVWLTFVSDMLGWTIQPYKLRRNEGGPNKWNTCFGDRTNIQTTFVNSFIAAATEAQASEHINQSRDYIHLSHGHSSLHAGPASCWHCLRLCCLPLLLPILTVLPIRQAGEGKRQTWRDVGFAVRGGSFSSQGLVIKWGIDAYTLLWWGICTYLFDLIAFMLINTTVTKATFSTKEGHTLQGLIFPIECALHMKSHEHEDSFKCKIIHDVWCKKRSPQPLQLQIWQAQLESNQSQSYWILKYGLRP